MVKEKERFNDARILEYGCPPTPAFPPPSENGPDPPKVWCPFIDDEACHPTSELSRNEVPQGSGAGRVNTVPVFDNEGGSLGFCGLKQEKGGVNERKVDYQNSSGVGATNASAINKMRGGDVNCDLACGTTNEGGGGPL